jgi:hypothetical protein
MRRETSLGSCWLVILAFFSLLVVVSSAWAGSTQPVLVMQSVDESKLTTLRGNTRPEANAKNDQGLVADNLSMEHMLLQLKRSPEKERELQKFIDGLQNQSSPNFHRWLTAKEFGERFGVSKQDRDTVAAWLTSHGFTVNVVYANGMLIDFSGTAGQVHRAFNTEIHQLDVKGVKHFANMSDPQIPAALQPAVAGIVSLHNFMPHPMFKPKPDYTFGSGGSTYYAVTPPDLATIYNLNPLFSAGISGQGQTVVVIENTDVYTMLDWKSFRSTFGLSSYTNGSFTQVHPAPPSGSNNCSAPGYNSDDQEAILDAEYASAAAPSAAIELAACADSQTTFGGLIALQNLLNESSTPPPVISISYGECEAYNGATSNATYYATYQQAAAEGVSVFVSSGDEGAASCDANQSSASYGVAVSGLASTPYNVAVGGTDFGDTYAGTNSTYWNATNSPTYESALSYIPEIPWNDSCAGSLLAQYEGYSEGYGEYGFCSSGSGQNYYTTAAGSGGPSGCATGTPSVDGVVSGTCAGWPKPSWQALTGNPSDGVRDIPDVSLFAANGLWGHYYPYCYSGGGTYCDQAPDTWPGAGGTSFSSPIMAGIQALVNQKTKDRQGNPNPVYYSLAASEYGSSGDSSCNSTLGNGTASSCVFYDVTQGDMVVNCTGNYNCYFPSGLSGALSVSSSSFEGAYGTNTGWDFATGIGSLNAANLVNSWPTKATFTLSATPYNVSVTQGSSATSTITVTPLNGFSGSVTLSASGLPNGVTASFGTNPTTSTSTLTLTASSTATAGTTAVTINGTSGKLTLSTNLSLTVQAQLPGFSLVASPSTLTIAQGGASGTSNIAIVPVGGFSNSVTLIASGLPKGVSATFSSNPATSNSVLSLTASATAAKGTVPVTITGYYQDTIETTTVNLTVNPFGNFTLTPSPKVLTVPQGSGGTSTITINPTDTFDQNVKLSVSGLPAGVTATITPNPATSTATLSLAVSDAAAVGTSAITITGTAGKLVHKATVTLKVVEPDFTLTAAPQSLTIAQGRSASSTITINPIYTFDGSVTLTVSGVPDGVSASISPNPTTSSSALTLAVSDSAAIGTTTITITGAAGSLSHTTKVRLKVVKP